jgi:hypothetical protein
MTIFDQESDARAEAASDLTREFWGDNAGWVGRNQGRATPFQLQRPDHTPSSFSLDHRPASMRAIRDGLAAFRPTRRSDSTGQVERTREHGVVTAGTVVAAAPSARPAATPVRRPSPVDLPHRDASIGDLAAGRFDGAPGPRRNRADVPVGPARIGQPVLDDDRNDDLGDFAADEAEIDAEFGLVALTSRREPSPGLFGSVDPTVLRVTLVVLAVILAIPLALALRNDPEPVVETDPSAIVPPVDANGAAFDGPETQPAPGVSVAPQSTPGGESAAAFDSGTEGPDAAGNASADDASALQSRLPQAENDPSTGALATAPTTEADTAALAESTDSSVAESASSPVAATVTEVADREVPDCSRTYTAGPGDSWYRMADEAGITPATLLAQNRATLDTVIFPGSEICLPAGAAMPSPPTTAAPVATPAPTTAAPTTAAPTTAAPTTAAPTTTVAAPPASSRAEVQALIREIWPDELEERALEIARRESNFYADADNGWCCVGVFQIYWTAHRSWLDDYGITTREGLKDARKNITAAYALYQNAGGWGPWGG